MSQQSNDTGSAKGVEDVFAELSKDDKDSLDLTTPVSKKDEEKPRGEDGKFTKADATPLDESETEEDAEEEDEEEIDELKEIEEDLKEIDEEKLELTTPVRRREILKKYPNLFKDFPYLEKAYYREQQFTEILSTIDDAKQAAESHRVLQRYSEDMVEKGNVNNVLKMIKDTNPDTYANVVDNYLGYLEQVDPAAHLHVQSNLVKQIIIGMVNEAKASQDDDLRTAALLLNRWAFGSSKFTPPTKMGKAQAETEQETRVSQREQELNKRQIDTAVGEVNTRVNNAIKAAIDQHIDPNGSMTDYVKRNASRDALDKISNLIEKDRRFQQIVEKLWEKSAKNDFSKESQDEIRRAFLSKAKSLLAPVLKSARNEALKGMGKRVKEDSDVTEETETPQRQKIGKSERSLSSGNQKAKLDSLKGKSSYEALQALMGD